jgi:orotate phosphoribosyltransferase
MLAKVGIEKIVLIDDVVTTGATLQSATTALKNAGHSVVGFLTFAETEAKRCNLTTQASFPAYGGTSWN